MICPQLRSDDGAEIKSRGEINISSLFSDLELVDVGISTRETTNFINKTVHNTVIIHNLPYLKTNAKLPILSPTEHQLLCLKIGNPHVSDILISNTGIGNLFLAFVMSA